MRHADWQMFDGQGQRKYLTAAEIAAFLAASEASSPDARAFCLLLAATGCRISEALAVTKAQLGDGAVVLRCLKRRKPMFRRVHLPPPVFALLEAYAAGNAADAPLWPYHRATAYRWVKEALGRAGIDGTQAMPKGLRHGFGIRAAQCNVPASLIQRWLGHASPETTALYLQAVGEEEQGFAARLWADGLFRR